MKTLTFALLLLAAPSLFADANLSVTVNTPNTRLLAGHHYSFVVFTVRNNGPDAAAGVKFAVSSSGATVTSGSDLNTMKPNDAISIFVDIDTPLSAGNITVTGTATSNTPDPNPADNTATKTFEVSTDPDLFISIGALSPQDLGVPFTLTIDLANPSNTTAHDVDATVDLPAGVGIRSLPAGCSSPAAGRIVCHLDELPPTPVATPFFPLVLVAPATYGSGSVAFSATVIERETDFNPSSNQSSFNLQLYDATYVTTTANDGSGSLRAAIDEVNARCGGGGPCTIAFRIEEPSPTPWKTIRVTSPLPMLLAPRMRLAGATQTGLVGDSNPGGPEIEISGGGTLDADGLVVAGCADEIFGVAVGGFGGNGVSITDQFRPTPCTFGSPRLHDLYIGTDPTGSAARPNLRGIGMSVRNGTSINTAGAATNISDCLISGNLRSGIFGLSGRLNLTSNRIGVKAHADEPLPNGNAGVYIGPGGYGSDVGPNVFSVDFGPADKDGNVIAFNGQMGVAVAAGVGDVAIRHNRIWGNGGLGIDVGLDGPTPAAPAVPAPVLTLAHFDPAAGQTVIEGDLLPMTSSFPPPAVEFFADGGQRPLGSVRVTGGTHFRFTFAGDLTGHLVTATATRYLYLGFAEVRAQGIDQLLLTQTSELSRPIEVR